MYHALVNALENIKIAGFAARSFANQAIYKFSGLYRFRQIKQLFFVWEVAKVCGVARKMALAS